MGIYRNQAQRVIDHIVRKMELSEEKINEHFQINIDKIEKSIEDGVKITGFNGFKMANVIIDLWEKSNPDFASS